MSLTSTKNSRGKYAGQRYNVTSFSYPLPLDVTCTGTLLYIVHVHACVKLACCIHYDRMDSLRNARKSLEEVLLIPTAYWYIHYTAAAAVCC